MTLDSVVDYAQRRQSTPISVYIMGAHTAAASITRLAAPAITTTDADPWPDSRLSRNQVKINDSKKGQGSHCGADTADIHSKLSAGMI